MEKEIQNLIEEFIKKTSFGFDKVSVDLDMDSGSYWCSIETPDSNFLIGRGGENIFNINYLIRRILEKKYKENTPRVTIDINNYQKSKIDKIKTIAHMMAERARFFKSRVELEPMNSFERRVVHEYVSKHSDISSESDGYGKNRRVVISFVNK